MTRQRCPCLRPTLVVDVDDEGSANEKNRDEDANAALALAAGVDDEVVRRRDGALGRETGLGESSLSSSTDPSPSPFNPGQNLTYFNPGQNLANVPQIWRQ